jgi:hypothetical protein
VTLAARTLFTKRRKGVAKTWGGLVTSLGDTFPAHFERFARDHPPDPAGPAADGHAFARWLDARRLLPPAAVPDLLAAGLARRRAPAAGDVRRADGRLVVALKLPLLGVRVASFRWFA